MTKLRSLATADMLANDGAFPQSVLEDSPLLATLYPGKAEFAVRGRRLETINCC
jgi:hypothetical protein